MPAQFGNIGTGGTPSKVNSAYTSAKPNVVLVTLGADDLKFVNILTACIEWNYIPAVQRSDNGHTASPYSSRYSGKLQCSDDNESDRNGPTSTEYPDGVIQDLYTNQLQSLHTHLTSLLTAIGKEGQESGQSAPPKIVITNYPNPLPNSLPQKDGSSWSSDYCPDTFPLYNAQVDYFSGLVDQINSDLASWVSDYQKTGEFGGNVAFVNLSNLDHGYQWCDDASGNLSPNRHDLEYREPNAYGFSVNGSSTSLAQYPSPAIFHPTVKGQQQIAACVKPAVEALLRSKPSSTQSRTIRLQGQNRIVSKVDGPPIHDSC